jgi:hypothetical protein
MTSAPPNSLTKGKQRLAPAKNLFLQRLDSNQNFIEKKRKKSKNQELQTLEKKLFTPIPYHCF